MTNGKICLRAFAFCWSADCLPVKLTSDTRCLYHFVRIAARREAGFKICDTVIKDCFRRVCSKKSKGFTFNKTFFNACFLARCKMLQLVTVLCTRKPLLRVSARIMLIYKQLSRSINYLSQSCQQSSIQPIRSWHQELVSWNGASMECLQAPLHSPSSPDRSRLVPLALDYNRLSRPKQPEEPVCRLSNL